MSDVGPKGCSRRGEGAPQSRSAVDRSSPRWLANLRQVLFLPEASDYIATSAEESFALANSSDCAHFISALKDDARQEGIHINVGIHEVASGHRLKNSLVWIDDKGTVTQNYQKIHLFDVEIKDGPILQESK